MGHVGLGLGLGGGIGLSMRQHGLACDSIIAAKIVLANGSLVSPHWSTQSQAYMLICLLGRLFAAFIQVIHMSEAIARYAIK